MKITVTQEHIDKGIKGNTNFCALSLAFKSAGFPNAFVGTQSWWPYGAAHYNELIRVDLPALADEFRFAFDSGCKVRPFSFHIEVPLANRGN